MPTSGIVPTYATPSYIRANQVRVALYILETKLMRRDWASNRYLLYEIMKHPRHIVKIYRTRHWSEIGYLKDFELLAWP